MVQFPASPRFILSARPGFKRVERVCISSSPVFINRKHPSVDKVLRDLNEAMVGEPEKVKSEKEELRGDEIKELRRRL